MATLNAPVSVLITTCEHVQLEAYVYLPGFAPGIAPHAHDQWQVCYSPDAGGHIRAGRAWVEARPGAVYVVPPSVEHTSAKDTTVERPSTYFVLYFSSSIFGPDAPRRRTPSRDRSPGCVECTDPAVVSSVRRLIGSMNRGAGAAQIEEATCRLLETALPTTPPIAVDLLLARRVRDALLANPTSCATLAELARATGATPHRVRSTFKRTFGVPPARYHLMHRLSLARDLIRDGVATSVAATRLGFVDQAHFSNRLRRYFGHPPGSISRG